eukprot:COSAG02_NODE_2321_length_9138_cov_11.428366_7_plen_220_part_00
MAGIVNSVIFCPIPISHSVTMLFGAFHRNRKEQVRVASAIAIQTVWRKMKLYKRTKSPKSDQQSQLNSKEVLLALGTLKQVRVAPLDFEQDFAARVESKMWEMNAEIDELKEEIKSQHETLRRDVLKEMALIQGRMSKAIVEEVRKATSRRSTPKLAPERINKQSRESGSTPKKNKSTARSSKSQSSGDAGHMKGNALSSVAAAKKHAARTRSRRLSRD